MFAFLSVISPTLGTLGDTWKKCYKRNRDIKIGQTYVHLQSSLKSNCITTITVLLSNSSD